MKKLLLLANILVLGAGVFAQKKAEDVVKFKELKYDFGKVKQNVPATHEFSFTNISDGPIVIESAVAKGKTDKIAAAYNAASPGPFNKTITVKIAGIDLPVQLFITGEVLTPDAYTKYESEKDKNPKTVKSGAN